MTTIAQDLKRHLSTQLQDAIGRHADNAVGGLEPADILYMMLGAAADATCCAVSSVAASLANAGGMDDAATAALVDDMIERQCDMLRSTREKILMRIAEAVAAERAKAA